MAASRTGGASLASRLKAFVDSPTGPKTTHFWGPVANWGFVLAVSCCESTRRSISFCALEKKKKKKKVGGPKRLNCSRFHCFYPPAIDSTKQGHADTQKPAELISPNMTGGEIIWREGERERGGKRGR